MKIAIIGAGNMGTTIAADLARNNSVSVHSSKPQLFTGVLKYVDSVTSQSFESKLALVSNDYEKVLEGAELVFVTLPTTVIKETIDNILPYVNTNTVFGFVPGAGGVEFLSASLIKRGCCVFGFERVPYIARLQEYGRTVSASKKDKYRIAVFPRNRREGLAETIGWLFNRPCSEMNSFLSMTLTPTLHTSRLYDLYSNYKKGELLADNPYFYAEWRDSASEICLQLDDELHIVTKTLEKYGLNISELVPYTVHYESPTVKALTTKLRSISSLTKIKGPVKENPDGTYTLDLESRYFTESYPFRLAIVKGLAELVNEGVPLTTRILEWYEKLLEKHYFNNGRLSGADVDECNIPQNHGIKTINDLLEFYGGAH